MKKLLIVLLLIKSLVASNEKIEKNLLFLPPEIKKLIKDYLDNWIIKRRLSIPDKITCLEGCYNINNPYLALGADDKLLILDVNLNKVFKSFKDHSASITAVCFLKDPNYIAVGCKDGEFKIWHLLDGNCVNKFKLHLDEISKIVNNKDGVLLTTSSFDKTLKVYNFEQKIVCKEFIGHTQRINTFTFSPDGKYLASAGEEKTIKIWDFDNGNCLHTLNSHTDEILSLAYLENNKIISGSKDCTIKIWEIDKEESVTLNGHSNAIIGLVFFPEAQSFVSASRDGNMGLWDCSTKNLDKLNTKEQVQGMSILNSDIGNDIVIFTNDNKIIILSLLRYLSLF